MTRTLPPCASAVFLTIASPKPVPSSLPFGDRDAERLATKVTV
nr:hypothetical protein [Halorubrum sp. BOL3-1]